MASGETPGAAAARRVLPVPAPPPPEPSPPAVDNDGWLDSPQDFAVGQGQAQPAEATEFLDQPTVDKDPEPQKRRRRSKPE
jgi:hypothetical protein